MEPGDDADRSDYAREVAEVFSGEDDEPTLARYRVEDSITGEIYMHVLAPNPSLAFVEAIEVMRRFYFDAADDDIRILYFDDDNDPRTAYRFPTATQADALMTPLTAEGVRANRMALEGHRRIAPLSDYQQEQVALDIAIAYGVDDGLPF